ncbi:MAG: thioesterase family protein, partial [Leucobacter sp.]|nr:thioesterase family protein [Leucobacter sp.]
LDHAMWFHRPFRVDDWLLYVLETPTSQGGRGLALGRFYDQTGALVASVAQESTVRPPQDTGAPSAPAER